MEEIKVIITGLDNPNRWYKHFIGSTFTVKENCGLPSYVVIGMLSEHDSVYRIEKTDCRLIEQANLLYIVLATFLIVANGKVYEA